MIRVEKFNKSLRGYNPAEVNQFIDQVISKVEGMITEIEKKDREIRALEESLEHYENMEDTLHKAIIMSEETANNRLRMAKQEADIIIEDAKKNANRIVNEALVRAEKTEYEANLLRRNINIFKRRLKAIIEAQLEAIDEIDKVEL